MNIVLFVTISSVYVTSLALIDGLFNRLVFREKRKLPYNSDFKKDIYKSWEWAGVGVVFLVILPVIVPVVASYAIGGLSLVLVYLMIFLLVPWDIIFGWLVFDDPFGDTPSICLPYFGWLNFPLWPVQIARIVLVVSLFLVWRGM